MAFLIGIIVFFIFFTSVVIAVGAGVKLGLELFFKDKDKKNDNACTTKN